MAMAAASAESTPMMDINTTPLIDVMLVLLIMFIITIPVQTHAVKLDLPVHSEPRWHDLLPLKNKMVVTADDRILWNGSPINLTVLREYLDQTQAMNPIPELQVQPDPEAHYILVDKVLAATKRAQVERMGFVGNEAYARF